MIMISSQVFRSTDLDIACLIILTLQRYKVFELHARVRWGKYAENNLS